MAILNDENFSEVMADRDDQKLLLNARVKNYKERKVRKAEFSVPDDGWYVLDDSLVRDIKLAKEKSRSEQLEDKLWCLLSRMGFKYLSRDRLCRLQYDTGTGAAQQIDVLAVDDECVVIFECKCADSGLPKLGSFKTEIEALGGKKAGLHREIRTRFKNPDLKIAYVLATENYTISQPDIDRLKSFNIHHLAETELEYYAQLVEHLGPSARYQFQGDLFGNQDIPSIENRIYAIEGAMGGIKYFSFAIEPERLLKLGYVLHRSKSSRLLPSYQRLIKKTRLSSIKKFIENGGYFPNSIVVNIDAGGKALKFDRGTLNIDGSPTAVGVLHLPPKYRSMYIIDGQHRLYAYSDSDYAESNTIPVVAFVDLDPQEQLRLFMEINENQKAVSKNLKHTLDADLKWDSLNLNERADGVKKTLAQELGEDILSPLFNRVLIGEDHRTETRVITLEAILKGIDQTRFMGKFTKNAIREVGFFYTGNSKSMLDRTKRILFDYLSYVAQILPEEWQRLPRDNGILTINDGITALIAVFGDIVQHMVDRKEIAPLTDSPEKIIGTTSTYIDGIKAFFTRLKDTERAELRKKYGSGAPTRLRRIFQLWIHEHREDFSPLGLDEYWRDQSKQYNLETYSRVADIETRLRDDVKDVLMEAYGNMWLKRGMPEKVYTNLVTEAAKKNRLIENEKEEKTPWDCLMLIHLREIMEHQAQWSTLFQRKYTIPGQEGRKKEEKTSWLVKLNTIRNNADHEYSVSKDEADYVGALHDWLILEDSEPIAHLSKESVKMLTQTY
ncbi:DGQHR domain-containing protein [Nitrosospira briensis]|uniref:DGQHR domain-containing protein n=1 Tax=Nitrosospira briensis TaxID=35799 RepID=UPI0008E4E92D|nr:DGQHR domain-containing protein [Nitrosospira briensis]SFO38699.1 DNA sulfur modification protein DndB [Nitrosospira briensis]